MGFDIETDWKAKPHQREPEAAMESVRKGRKLPSKPKVEKVDDADGDSWSLLTAEQKTGWEKQAERQLRADGTTGDIPSAGDYCAR